MTSLVGHLLFRTLAVLVGALVAVGVATGAVLVRLEARAVDRELLAAATAYSGEGSLDDHHVRSRVVVGPAGALGARPEWLAAARASERPVWVDAGDRRVLLLVAERESEDEWADEHRVVLATSPIQPWFVVLGPFATAYPLAAGLVAVAATLALRRSLRRGVAPLAEAVATIEGATGAAVGTTVAATGPDEVRALLSAVGALLARRDDAYLAQARFSAAAAHELRTPVTALLGELDVTLRKPRTDDEYRAALGSARDEAHRLAALVEGLLLLARVDAGHAEQGRIREHVGVVVDAAVRRERPTIEGVGGSLAVVGGPDPEVEVHEALVAAAIANLLRNAALHAPGSEVSIRTELRGDRVAVVVEDNGPGFVAPPSFDRRPEGGLGLGLPLSREVARRHGGDCLVEGSVRGARVALLLPVGS